MSKKKQELQFIVLSHQQKHSESKPSTLQLVQPTPFVSGQDILALRNKGDTERMGLSDLYYTMMDEFARDIRHFNNGALVSKQRGPWGDDAILYNRVFYISKKVFTTHGDVVSVEIKSTEDNLEYLIDETFFSSWIDTQAFHSFL